VAQNAENHGQGSRVPGVRHADGGGHGSKDNHLMSKLSLKSFKPMPVATPEPIDYVESHR